MFTKEELDKLWASVRENGARLDGCVGPHDFEDVTPEKRVNKRYRCRLCQGMLGHVENLWYQHGLSHGRAEPLASRTCVVCRKPLGSRVGPEASDHGGCAPLLGVERPELADTVRPPRSSGHVFVETLLSALALAAVAGIVWAVNLR